MPTPQRASVRRLSGTLAAPRQSVDRGLTENRDIGRFSRVDAFQHDERRVIARADACSRGALELRQELGEHSARTIGRKK
jgi:hypothetical protein